MAHIGVIEELLNPGIRVGICEHTCHAESNSNLDLRLQAVVTAKIGANIVPKRPEKAGPVRGRLSENKRWEHRRGQHKAT